MNPNKELWEKGDFTKLAETMRESGTNLVAKLGITPGLDVLDLGCGDGTTAIPSARLGASRAAAIMKYGARPVNSRRGLSTSSMLS